MLFIFSIFREWFTAMDIDFSSRTLLAGDNHGSGRMYNLNDAKSLGTYRFHNTKIHDIQFSKWFVATYLFNVSGYFQCRL